MGALHRCSLLVHISHVVWSVCLFVCWCLNDPIYSLLSNYFDHLLILLKNRANMGGLGADSCCFGFHFKNVPRPGLTKVNF